MYESVIWVTWGCVLFSLIIWAAYRNAVIPTAATVFAIVGLVLADNLPAALDPNINPLEPVLRSNYWLTIHVLTITMSYAAFALSLCLGNVVLGNYFWRPEKTQVIQQFSLFMYRAMQIGVMLLATGTILGGVWADYSWGRFWGWDPKEVWALIALLLYLAVLHGRFTGWLRGFGFVATTVVAFLGVLMAWYGVNFVLGVGLHSYGFGTGGMSTFSPMLRRRSDLSSPHTLDITGQTLRSRSTRRSFRVEASRHKRFLILAACADFGSLFRHNFWIQWWSRGEFGILRYARDS